MQSKAATVAQYMKELPEDRKAAIQTVRDVILKNLDADIHEKMEYGMICYSIPHSVYPAGYHCDPKKPLPFGGLANQKNHMAVYLMTLYGPDSDESWFRAAWKKTGKKLDFGKSCIRFRKLEDLALEVIGEAVARWSAARYIKRVEDSLTARKGQAKTKTSSKASAAGKTSTAKSPSSKARKKGVKPTSGKSPKASTPKPGDKAKPAPKRTSRKSSGKD